MIRTPTQSITRTETVYETDRMIIRRFQARDLVDVHEILSDPEVAKYEFWDAYDLAETREDLKIQGAVVPGTRGVWNEFAVELKDASDAIGSERSGGKVIGNISFIMKDAEQGQAEMGFHFNRAYHGKGYGKEAVIGLIEYLWTLGAHRIWAVADTRNVNSWKMMERLGMRREAHMVHNCFIKGEWCDEYLYALLEKEWRGGATAIKL